MTDQTLRFLCALNPKDQLTVETGHGFLKRRAATMNAPPPAIDGVRFEMGDNVVVLDRADVVLLKALLDRFVAEPEHEPELEVRP